VGEILKEHTNESKKYQEWDSAEKTSMRKDTIAWSFALATRNFIAQIYGRINTTLRIVSRYKIVSPILKLAMHNPTQIHRVDTSIHRGKYEQNYSCRPHGTVALAGK
jgi:hypothetical protein